MHNSRSLFKKEWKSQNLYMFHGQLVNVNLLVSRFFQKFYEKVEEKIEGQILS